MQILSFFVSGLPALYMGVTVPLGFLLENGPHYAGSDAGLVMNFTIAWIWVCYCLIATAI